MKKLLLSLFVVAASGGYAFSQSGGTSPDESLSFGGPDLSASSATMAPASTSFTEKALAKPAVLRVSAALPASVADRAEPPAMPSVPAPTREAAVEFAKPNPPAPPTLPYVSPVKPVSVTTLIASNPALVAPPPAISPVQQLIAPIPSPIPPDLAQRRALFMTTSWASAQGQYRDGNYRGSVDNAYYGLVQVEAEIQGGRLVRVRILQYPHDRRTSRYIAHHSLPVLNREAIRAQSARIDTVSGATLTSRAYVRSLRHALANAGSTQARS